MDTAKTHTELTQGDRLLAQAVLCCAYRLHLQGLYRMNPTEELKLRLESTLHVEKKFRDQLDAAGQ